MSQNRAQKQQKRKNINQGRIASHKKEGSQLIAPFNQIPNTSYMSWLNDRLPCMVWAGLLINGIGRESAIEVFRSIGLHVGTLFREVEERECDLPRVGLYGLSTLDIDLQDKFFEVLFSEEGVVDALKPIMLMNKLPLSNKWKEYLGKASEDEVALWTAMADAVVILLDHQSQESTDCRWAYIIPIVNSGKLHLQTEEQFREYSEYPHYEDQRKVRPFIRSTEMQFGDGMMNDEYSSGKNNGLKNFGMSAKQKRNVSHQSPKNSRLTMICLKLSRQ